MLGCTGAFQFSRMQGEQMRGPNDAGKPGLRIDINGCHQIQTQQRQVRQIVLCEMLTTEMGMNTAQPAKAPSSYTHPLKVWKFNATVVADHYVLNVSLAINEYANLSARLM
jgi:hypothetical protein